MSMDQLKRRAKFLELKPVCMNGVTWPNALGFPSEREQSDEFETTPRPFPVRWHYEARAQPLWSTDPSPNMRAWYKRDLHWSRFPFDAINRIIELRRRGDTNPYITSSVDAVQKKTNDFYVSSDCNSFLLRKTQYRHFYGWGLELLYSGDPDLLSCSGFVALYQSTTLRRWSDGSFISPMAHGKSSQPPARTARVVSLTSS